MKILAIDTSTRHLSLAINDGDRLIASYNVAPRRDLSLSITFDVERILQKANVRLSEIDAFVIGRGPGSFTGLRVGFSMVKAFSLVTDRPVVGISSMDAMAMNVKTKKATSVCVVNDARRGLVYSALYEKKDGQLVRRSDYFLKPFEEILLTLKGDLFFIGDALSLIKDKVMLFQQQHPGVLNSTFASLRISKPYAKELAHLGYQRLLKGEHDATETLTPLYLYPQDCQVVNPWQPKQ